MIIIVIIVICVAIEYTFEFYTINQGSLGSKGFHPI